MATKDYVVNLSDFTAEGYEIDAKKKTAIRIDGLTLENAKALTYSINEGNLVISDGAKSLKVLNYSGIKYIKTDYVKTGKKETFKLYDIISENAVDNTTNPMTAYDHKKLTVTGTNYNDAIDMSASGYAPTGKNVKTNKGLTINGGSGSDTITGTDYNDTIKGGNGNDTITGGKGNDAITGGAGTTIINYKKGDGNDIINLTKGENFTLNLTDLNKEDLNYAYTNKNKDLVISYDKGGVKGSVTIKNFVSKDVTNNSNAKKKIEDTSSVELVTQSGTIDLRTKVYSSSTGTRLNDNINMSEYENTKGKGLTLNGKGGDDIITGTKYADTIKGGDGNDVIAGGKGNDKLYGEAGNNTYTFNNGDGKDIIYSGKGEDTILLNNISLEDIADKFERGNTKKTKKDLTINYTENDSVTIKNYYATDKKGNPTNTVKYITLNEGTFLIEDFMNSNILIKGSGEINGNDYDNIILGSDTDDTIHAKDGNDIVYAKDGNDTVYAEKGNNTIYGNGGNDKLYGGTGNDTIYGGDGDDNIHGSNGNNKLYGDSGNDIIWGGNGDDYINGGDGDDKLYGYSGKNTIDGGAGNDTIYGSDDIDTINGGSGEDTIQGYAGNDIINGDAGDDTINGSAGDDIITGGKGNDTLDGGTENNTFIFNNGDGQDIINKSWGNDTVQLDTKSTLKFSHDMSNNDLVMGYGTGTDNITFKDYFNENSHSVKTVKNGDEALSIEDSIAKYGISITGTANADTINGSTGNDTINGGLGNDALYGANGDDTIYGDAGDDIIYGNIGDDHIEGGDGNDAITGGKGNDKLYGNAGNNTFTFNKGDGKDIIYSGNGVDTLIFNENISPVDVKFQKSGETDLVINYNFVDDAAQDSITIKNYYNTNGNVVSSVKYINVGGREYDLETFKNYADKNAIIASSEGNIIGDDNGNILIASGSAYQKLDGQKGNDILYASDNYTGDELFGGEGDDILYGSNYNGSDVNVGQCDLRPGSGNDIVYAGEYCSKYIYLDNQSNTTIYTSSGENNAKGENARNWVFLDNHGNKNSSNQHDTIYWQGTNNLIVRTYYNNSSDLILTKEKDSDDLVIRYAGGNTLAFKDYYKAGNEEMANIGFQTKDYGWIKLSAILEQNGGVMTKIDGLTGTDNADFIEGTDEAETINGKDGNDVINPLGGNDTIHLGAGNDYMFRGNGDKIIYADSGNNTIWLGKGNNTVYAGTGKDEIYSGNGQDTIEFAAADTGDDKYNFNGTNKTLVFKGDTLNDLTMSHTAYQPEGGEVVVTRGNGKKVTFYGGYLTTQYNPNITIKDKNGNTSQMIDLNTIVGDADYTITQAITTGAGNDIISIGKGNDTIKPGAGTNTIKLTAPVASGNKNIYIYENGTDTFELPEGTTDLSGVELFKIDNDLVIGYDGSASNNIVKIKNFYNNTAIGDKISLKSTNETKTINAFINEHGCVEAIVCDGVHHEIDQSGAAKAVNITGCEKADSITGSSYNDIINGKGGGDMLIGRAGDDTYIIDTDNYGKGQDVINDASGSNDKLLVGAYINENVNHDEGDTRLYFEVIPTGTITDGNAEYTTGNDLYLVKNKDYTFEDATTSKGVKIENYFTYGKIEHIRNADDTQDVVKEKVVNAIGQTVANWLSKNGYTSTTDAIANATDDEKEALLKLYKPFVSTWSNKTGTKDDDFIIATESTYQSLYGANGNDVIYASDNYGRDYIGAGDGDDIIYGSNYNGDDVNVGHSDIYTNSGNDTVYAGEYCYKYIFLGNGDDTVYTSSGELNAINNFARNQIWIDQYASKYNGGHDTIYWRGTQALSVYFYGYDYKELAFTRTGTSNDLIVRYGDDNTVTMKDYFKAGNEALANTYTSYMNNRGGQYIGTLIGEGMGYQEGIMDYTETTSGSYDGDDNNNYIVAKSNCGGVNAGEGSDVVVAEGYCAVYTNKSMVNKADGKDETPWTYDNVKLVDGNKHSVFAQSQTNIITSTKDGGSNDDYWAFIDQTTYIDDNGGDDYLYLTNSKNTTDAAKTNLKVMFDVSSDYTYDGTEASKRLVGDVLITDTATKANFNQFKDRINYRFNGIYIKDNNIDMVYSSDEYSITSEDIATLAQDVAGWLSDNSYDSVSKVFEGNNEVDINAIIAKFNTANWVYNP